MLPPIAVLMVAAFAHFSQEQAIEAAVGSYVQDLAESMAYRLSTEGRLWNLPEEPFSSMARYRIFSWGPAIPGWVAYISADGRVIMSSPGATNIATLWKEDLPVGTAVRVKDREGHRYTMAAYHMDQGRGYVVAAVSWDQLLGGLVRVGRLWPILIVVMTLGSFLSIRLLWGYLISPLRGLVAEIDDLRMGRDILNTVNPGGAEEIASVRDALTRFARAAVDRDNLHNRYVRDIVQVQEAERLDMAREIHDGPLQDITALLQQIHMFEEGEDIPVRIRKVEYLARAVVRELRGLCDELAPPWVELSIANALTELAERLSQNYEAHVSVDADESIDLGSERTLSLVRIFQEAVSNAVRHGEATEIQGQMFEDGDHIVFEIRDNGRGFNAGFDHETLRVEGHRGLANMTERMLLMGGSLEVKSKTGEGTCIRCVMKRDPDAQGEMS
ncbi:MAG: histidine kinase [Synergistaceae bacterium]|jgi:signal transduction histidine kinase|nr:histidine kinase [Synergistaceae bacterium]